MFNALRKAACNQELIINKRYEELSKLTAIVDPNKFPIFSLIEVVSERDLVSLWEYREGVFEKVKRELGFYLEVA